MGFAVIAASFEMQTIGFLFKKKLICFNSLNLKVQMFTLYIKYFLLHILNKIINN